MYFTPELIAESQRSGAKHREVGVAMGAFLHSLGAGVLASVEQLKEDMYDTFPPFDAEIEARIGMGTQKLGDISDYIIEALNQRLEEGPKALMRSWRTFRQSVDEQGDPEAALADARRNAGPRALSEFALIGQIQLHELQGRFSADEIRNYLSFLSCARTETPTDFLFPTEQHILEQRPLVIVGLDTYHLLTGNILYLAILRGLDSVLGADEVLATRLNRHKGKIWKKKLWPYLRSYFKTKPHIIEICTRLVTAMMNMT